MKIRKSSRPPVAALAALLALCPLAGGCGVASVVSAAATVTGETVKTTAKVAGAAGRGTVKGVRATTRFATRPFRDEEPKPAEAAPQS
ncbi:MAG: hypothetical protein VX871_11400 [Pseudomonadota bacterium]|nr:hypothetical protein [Pseudomonadota bacterium]